jgi:hypothetical protein
MFVLLQMHLPTCKEHLSAVWSTNTTIKAPGRMIMIDQSETQRAAAAIRPCFCIALEKSVRLGCACYVPSPQEGKGCKNAGPKPFW